MPKVDRNNPVRAKSSESTHSLMEFMKRFPDDEACLNWLWRTRCSEDGEHAYCRKCKQDRAFKRYKTAQRRQSWTCTACGLHVQPTAGTIFEGSATSLHLWFYAMYLMASTRCGVSAKQLERELGVTYKCAWRIFNRIRNVAMADLSGPLSGDVEVDEASVDGKPRKPQGRHPSIAIGPSRRSEAAKLRERSRATVFAAVERGGRIKATVLPSRHGPQLKQQVIEWVDPESIIITDDWGAYNGLKLHFIDHSRINHSTGMYVEGSTHTNTVEGFFGHLKPSIKGTYRRVSHKWLQGYLNEFTWRRNARLEPESMFDQLLQRAAA
ncbi:MAG TPA: IS1595 family transposase [Solirubrobacteraceae bacterium]|nr:IS1595 family transposase [Solirubrobacteraceae bacterium]